MLAFDTSIGWAMMLTSELTRMPYLSTFFDGWTFPKKQLKSGFLHVLTPYVSALGEILPATLW